jgi:hypothetical protein
MAYFRRLGVIGILGACFFVAAGCGDDDDKITSGDAGEGGESTAGSGGKSQGGSNSNAGKGGTGGAGKAGSGGAPTAGSAGTAGTANDGGAAGEVGTGGSGGEPPVGGSAGEGGTSTSGGVTGEAGAGGTAPVFGLCATSCQIDPDCAVGEDTTQKCNTTTHRCVDPSLACETNDDCVPGLAFWQPCGIDAGCGEGLFCIDWHGKGYCAGPPDAEFGCFGDTEMSLPLVGAQGEETVCVPANARCGAQGQCFIGCGFFGFCPDGLCDAESGLCKCSTDDECSLNSCLADSTCAECAKDEDCASNELGNKVCVDGKCGCSGTQTCPESPYANAPVVCE